MRISVYATALAAAGLACGTPEQPVDTSAASALESGTPEGDAVLALVNDPVTTVAALDEVLDARAARNIVAHRDGPDGIAGTADDDLYDTVEELDGIKYVGNSALQRLLDLAKSSGYYDGGDEPDEAAIERAVLALANDRAVTFAVFDDDVGLDRRAAANIVAYRDGADGVAGTADDRDFASIEEIDAISYVGSRALRRLEDYAIANGYLDRDPSTFHDVVFSPKPYELSHNVRIAQLIDTAQSSLDIAMYSYSDARIAAALEAAVDRGVKVRFIFETANADRKKSGAELANTKSARLERMGINVRWVNKIMHHKFMIIDGPRDDLAAAATAKIVSGSGNWSNGAATRYDENTLFLDGHVELTLRLQKEFNRLWTHSRDLIFDEDLPYELSAVTIEDIHDDPDVDVIFTSPNFSASGDTFRIRSGSNALSDRLVAAIAGATDSIWVASGHLRSRPVSEALIAKAKDNPQMDIRIILDSQEYISTWVHDNQVAARVQCLEDAGDSASRIRRCNDKGFKFGYQVGLDIPVRYKYYAYRWHYSYALQMHHKLLIIDGDEVWTGSYNLSDNAEHNTFENMFMFRGDRFADLVDAYEANFMQLWGAHSDDGTLEALTTEVTQSESIPLVFTPMSLDWDQITQLKNTIRANCTDINTEPYRTEPENHRYCTRVR